MPRKLPPFTQRDVTRAVAGLLKAGVPLARAEIDPTGRIVLVTGLPEASGTAPAETPETLREKL